MWFVLIRFFSVCLLCICRFCVVSWLSAIPCSPFWVWFGSLMVVLCLMFLVVVLTIGSGRFARLFPFGLVCLVPSPSVSSCLCCVCWFVSSGLMARSPPDGDVGFVRCMCEWCDHMGASCPVYLIWHLSCRICTMVPYWYNCPVFLLLKSDDGTLTCWRMSRSCTCFLLFFPPVPVKCNPLYIMNSLGSTHANSDVTSSPTF